MEIKKTKNNINTKTSKNVSGTKSFSNKTKVTTIVLHSLIVVFSIIAASLLTRFLVNWKDTWNFDYDESTSKWITSDIETAWYIAIPATIFMWAIAVTSSVMFVCVANIIGGKDKAKVDKAYKDLSKFAVAFISIIAIAFVLLIIACVIGGQKIDFEGEKLPSPFDSKWSDAYSGYNAANVMIAGVVFTGFSLGLLSAEYSVIPK